MVECNKDCPHLRIDGLNSSGIPVTRCEITGCEVNQFSICDMPANTEKELVIHANTR